MLSKGERVPAFVARGTEGEVSLARLLKDGAVVLYFFPRAMTSGCTQEALEFNQLLPEFEALGVRVYGVSVDSVARLQRFREKFGLRLSFISDEHRTIGAAYGTLKSGASKSHERDTVLIDSQGTVLLAYERVVPRGHAARVLEEARRVRDEGLI